MSRRGHSSPHHHPKASGSGTGGQTEAELSDPFWVSNRYGHEEIRKLVKECFKYASNDGERLQVIERGQGLCLKLIRMEMKHVAQCSVIGLVADEIQNEDRLTDESIINDVARIEENALKKAAPLEREITLEKMKEHAQYKSLMELVDQLETDRRTPRRPNVTIIAEVEEGPSTRPVEEIIPTTDPITKQSLNDPVRNKHCSHIYGKAAILEMVRKNPQIRCPTIGCNNRNYIKKSDLIYDPVLANKINQKQREAAKKKIEQQKQQLEEQRHHRSPRHRSPRHHHQSPK